VIYVIDTVGTYVRKIYLTAVVFSVQVFNTFIKVVRGVALGRDSDKVKNRRYLRQVDNCVQYGPKC